MHEIKLDVWSYKEGRQALNIVIAVSSLDGVPCIKFMQLWYMKSHMPSYSCDNWAGCPLVLPYPALFGIPPGERPIDNEVKLTFEASQYRVPDWSIFLSQDCTNRTSDFQYCSFRHFFLKEDNNDEVDTVGTQSQHRRYWIDKDSSRVEQFCSVTIQRAWTLTDGRLRLFLEVGLFAKFVTMFGPGIPYVSRHRHERSETPTSVHIHSWYHETCSSLAAQTFLNEGHSDGQGALVSLRWWKRMLWSTRNAMIRISRKTRSGEWCR